MYHQTKEIVNRVVNYEKYKFFWMISLSSLFFILLCSGAWANSWDDLVRFYDLDKRMTYEAHILRQKLLQEACNISSEELLAFPAAKPYTEAESRK